LLLVFCPKSKEHQRLKKTKGIDENIIKEAIKKVIWQCRFEVYSKNPLVIFDGAHNLAGVEELIKIVKQHFSKDEVKVRCYLTPDYEYVDAYQEKVLTVAEANSKVDQF